MQEWLPADRPFPEEEEKYSATLRAVRYAFKLRGKEEAQNVLPDVSPAEKEAEYYLV
jgi:SulP family sulfate permease